MRFLAALCLLAFAPAAYAQQAPTSREQAQQFIFTALDDASFTVHNSNPAATGWYKGKASDPCLTRYQLFMPPHVAAGVAKPSKTYEFGVNWSEVKEAGPEPSNPALVRVKRNNATEWFHLPANRHAKFIAGANYLIRACGPAASAPTPKPQPRTSSTAVPPPGLIAEWLGTRALPHHWTVGYAGLSGGIHVFVYTADLRANPQSSMLDGETYLLRDICGDPGAKSLPSVMRMRADTVYVDAAGKRTVRGGELRCN